MAVHYTSAVYRAFLRRLGMRSSMGRTGVCYDNAMIESFWGRMQTELLDRKKWVTILELSAAMADYIDSFHNDKRRHSSLDMLAPTEYEQLHAPVLQLT